MEKMSLKIGQYKFFYQDGRVVNNLETWTDSKLSLNTSKKLKFLLLDMKVFTVGKTFPNLRRPENSRSLMKFNEG